MLKKKYNFIVASLIALAMFFGGAFGVNAQSDSDEKIINFSSNLYLQNDAGMKLSETIVYDFGNNKRHGIFRTFNTENADDKRMKVEIESVADEKGNPYTFTTSTGSKDVTIKIGDADLEISGTHTYVIKYELTNVATYFDDHDEFTWNVIGTGWSVPVLAASATMHLPETGADGTNVSSIISSLTYSCYRGSYGATGSCANKNIETNPDGTKNIIFTDKDLEAGMDLTVSAGMSKGIIAPAKEPYDFSGLAFLLPIALLIKLIMSAYKKRRDLKTGRTIIAEYEPPANMMPTLVGALADGTVHNRDMTAGLISAAEQGFIKINRIARKWLLGSADYELTLLKPVIALPQVTEQKIVEAFMQGKNVGESILLSDLNKITFSKEILKLNKMVYSEMIKRGFFTTNPINRKVAFVVGGFVLAVLSIAAGFATSSLVICFAILATAVIVAIWPFAVSARTPSGGDVKRHILGFKKFISVTDKARMEFHNAPEKNPEQFMKYLPFAIALGVQQKWAKQFEGMYMNPPSWYVGANPGGFNANTFARDLAVFTAFTGNSVVSSNSGYSSGGGFSGGGGGGGGGGSW
ncbi:MAG: DUF2207 domain-containing protein [Candidatus Pacebacteria bacterium]|nr:DUF2207 domain-containing protein [Candidatus Paceibacterota bacterium]